MIIIFYILIFACLIEVVRAINNIFEARRKRKAAKRIWKEFEEDESSKNKEEDK